MRDLEDLLKSTKKATPKRNLSASFTHDILDKINTKEPKSSIFMRIYKKPIGAVLTLALVFLSGATTFATVANWPAIVAVFDGEQPLESGARIVKIDTEGCRPIESSSDNPKQTTYYEIRKESPLTNDQAVAMMQGVCEEQRTQKKANELAQEIGGAVHMTRISTVESNNADGLTIVPDKNYNQEMMTTERQTYTNIAHDLKVIDGVSTLPLEDIKPGDSIIAIAVDERGVSTETQEYVEDISQMQLKVILKVPALTGKPDLFYKHVGKDFVRTEPANGNGFVRSYEFAE